ncbi:NAD(P)-dependent oxidoreductase [Telmatocola sphagniphila]|uniref:NAD(P)-dependent oxidoreductase n=1 Tax=Telmatocola sphagniphila TaxID=1123043 RepID=A0A8E6B4X6_9BACT|nr:NAD(P)-dependent oxidoreductase [Telmatocola sphagniphila]QVL31992.1 NAD(P)-dependent oxidoreductase [Telmatocola sphagniphila]
MTSPREPVLITGGSGFIGAFLAHELIEAGCDVHLLLRPEYQTWRLADIAGRFTPHFANLCDTEATKRLIEQIRPQVIYHLGTHGAYPSQNNRTEILATNLLGTANLIDALHGHDFQAFVHTGSSSEYGHKTSAMQTADRLDPRSDYGVSKAAATLLCQAEAFKNRPFSTVRVFAAYGPWEEPSRLVPYVMEMCARGIRPKVSAGQQPRDFIYVGDVTALLQHVAATPELRRGIWHAGTGAQSTVRDMIETIVSVCTQNRILPEYGAIELRPDEPTCWVADVRETFEKTGWKPKHTLQSGVREMWKWYQQRDLKKAA